MTTSSRSTPSGVRAGARRILAAALAAALLPAHASAADAPSDKDTVELERVVSSARADAYTVDASAAATKLSLSLRETPQSVTIVTRERMDDQDLVSLRDVLDNTTGIYSNAYDTERVLFYSRGFLVDNLMIDGLPIGSGTNFNTGAIDETADTALFERIEIVRGATGLMTGAGSPSASVNLVRKHADATTPRVALDLGLGSWNDRRVEADVSAPLDASGSVRGRVVAVYEDQDSYQALYHKKTRVLYGIVDADLAPSTTLSLGVDYQDNQPRGNTWGSFPLFLADGTPADWPRSVTTATDWSYWNRRTENAFGELRHAFDNDWQLHAAANWRRYKEDLALFYVYGFPDPATGEGLEPFAYRSEAEIIERSLDLYASGPFELFGRRHELVVGYDASRSTNVGEEFDVLDVAPTGNFFDWDGSYPLPVFGAPHPLSDITTRQDGAYAAARFSLADPLKFIAGARYASWKIDSFYLYDTPPDAPPGYRARYDFDEVIPYAGLVWDVGRDVSLFASWTGIFKPQNSRDANGHWLDPIDGSSIELGIKGEHFDGRLDTALTVFETRQDNLAAPLFDPVTGEPVMLPDGAQASFPIDGARTRGFELEATGRIGEDWNLSFGWSRALTHDADGVAVRTFIPSALVRAFATWNPSWLKALTLGGGVNWQARSSTTVGAPEGNRVLAQGGVALVNLMARYAFDPHVSLQLNANNAFDRKYYVLDPYDNTYYGTPANAMLSLHVAF
jgi:outer membrane receptor for ferric coprogen and ferric-rhodotorulic acid